MMWVMLTLERLSPSPSLMRTLRPVFVQEFFDFYFILFFQ
jgi:hypothetical protein